jgi:GAF domain-containing protein
MPSHDAPNPSDMDEIRRELQGLREQVEARSRSEAHTLLLTKLVFDISIALAERESLPTILNTCCETLVRELGAAFARVWVLRPDVSVLELKASAGLYTHLDGPHSRVPVGDFKIGRIAASRHPHLTNDVQNDAQVSNLEWAKREGMVAFAGHPLLVGDRLVGVLAVFSRSDFDEPPSRYSQQSLH